MNKFVWAALAALTASATVAHAAITVTIDINDPNAPKGRVRTFSGNGLTLGGLKAKVGNLKPGQAASMWCEGPEIPGGQSAFDVIVGSSYTAEVRRLNLGDKARLEAVCEADARASRR